MNTLQELEGALRLELIHWDARQNARPFDDFYLYYLPTTAEHDGGILISAGRPRHPEFQLAMPERIHKGQGVEANFRRIQPILRTLPVLTDRKETP